MMNVQVESEEILDENQFRTISGPFDKLPLLALEHILDLLPFKDVKKLRQLSSWFYKKVSFIKKSLFKTYTLRYLGSGNTNELLQTLSTAMQEGNESEKMLEFCFSNSVDPDFFEQILTKYRINIITLEIPVKRRLNDLLIDPAFKFDNLENLSLDFISGECMFRLVIENLLNLHSEQLKFLKIDSLTDEESLVFKDFLSLDFLSLHHVNAGLAFNLLSHCKETLTSLHFNHITLFDDVDVTIAPELYKLPNLSHLYLENVTMNSEESDVFGFVEHNANHLVSLSLDLVEGSNMYDFQWPTFPRLKYLMLLVLNTSELNPILSKCYETLECLVIKSEDDLTIDEMNGIKMPRLKDFYTCCVNPYFLENMLILNNNTLEFICMDGDIFLYDEVEIKLEKLKTILVSSEECSDEESSRLSSWWPESRICIDEKEQLWNKYREEFCTRCRNIKCSSLFRDKALHCLS